MKRTINKLMWYDEDEDVGAAARLDQVRNGYLKNKFFQYQYELILTGIVT